MVRYTIDENNAVHGYVEWQESPCLFQPHHPNGEAWSKDEATIWAEEWKAELTASIIEQRSSEEEIVEE
jgi:hypothetical protein